MNGRLLVAYASRAGSTAGVAEAVAVVLRRGGAEVDVLPVDAVRSLDGYGAVVLGSAVWAGRPLPAAVRFARAQRHALGRLPVAYFVLCETLREDTAANRRRARRFVEPLEQIALPAAVGVFAGAKSYRGVNPLVRWLMVNVLRSPEGDWRDWVAIRTWAAAVGPLLAGTVRSHPPAVPPDRPRCRTARGAEGAAPWPPNRC